MLERCQRGYSVQRKTMCEKVIPHGEIYRIAGAAYTLHCKECAAEVFGPRWALGEHSFIGRDGYQVEWHIRKQWAEAAAAYLATKAEAEQAA